MKPDSIFLPTANAMAVAFGAHPTSVAKWIARPDFPAKIPRKGWRRSEVEKFIIEAKRKIALQQSGPMAVEKRQKLLLEIDKLTLEIKQRNLNIAEQEHLLLPVEEHLSDIRELVQWFKDAFTLWIGEVKVLTGDVKLLREAERLRDNALARIKEKADAP